MANRIGECNLKTSKALTESQRDLIPSRLDLDSTPGRKGRGGNICDEELEKKVTDIITPMLNNQEKDISEVKDKMGHMEGLMYDIKRDLGLLTEQVAGIIEVGFQSATLIVIGLQSHVPLAS